MKNKSPREISKLAYRACVLEASAEKPGNVTPTRCFRDLCHADFVKAADELSGYVRKAAEEGEDAELGRLVCEATSSEKNANFGIIMMFLPLAACRGESTKRLLSSLSVSDTEYIIKAMRKGKLGGMELKDERLSKYDIFSEGIFEVIRNEEISALDLMKLSAPHDALAREWVEDYPISRESSRRIGLDEDSIIREYLRVLSTHPDSLIARKVGVGEAEKISDMAGKILSGEISLECFDSYLRADGNKRNPGTTADLIASALFLKLLLD